jgi:hypothetical protein
VGLLARCAGSAIAESREAGKGDRRCSCDGGADSCGNVSHLDDSSPQSSDVQTRLSCYTQLGRQSADFPPPARSKRTSQRNCREFTQRQQFVEDFTEMFAE